MSPRLAIAWAELHECIARDPRLTDWQRSERLRLAADFRRRAAESCQTDATIGE